MTYYEYFRNNVEGNRTRDISSKVQGTCCTMCPQEEIATREREKMVHLLEVQGNTRRLVKSYSRSAADSTMAVPCLLRPFPVLRVTVHYLLFEVTKRSDVPTSVVYDFINDRLRAVRQDVTIQTLPAEECMMLLEPMVRFYVYYGYKLCECSLRDFNPILNKKMLLECLKWFLNCCDLVKTKQTDKSVELLSRSISTININTSKQLSCDEVLMESLYILCNLDDVHPIYRYLSLPREIRRHSTLQLSYNIAIAHIKGNFVQVLRLAQKLCPLTHCGFSLHVPVIHRQSLRVLSTAYNSKQLSVPCDVIRRWLGFDSDAQALDTCRHYGIWVDEATVRFIKGQFNEGAISLSPSKRLLQDRILNLSIDNVFTYNTNIIL